MSTRSVRKEENKHTRPSADLGAISTDRERILVHEDNIKSNDNGNFGVFCAEIDLERGVVFHQNETNRHLAQTKPLR